MSRGPDNEYEDGTWASAYARLEFTGTYYLAFRDLPELIRRHVGGSTALDFGCGAGRSTRFLKELGFRVTGVDISEKMLAHAEARDPGGDYRLIADGELDALEGGYDLVLCAFPFDNIPGVARRLALFRGLEALLGEGGRIVNLVSSPELYVNEWASFTTEEFPENRVATSGETVRIVILDAKEQGPVRDLLWTDDDYRELYAGAQLEVLETHRPVGRPADPRSWVSESRIPPWTIYVLGRESEPEAPGRAVRAG